MSALRSLSDVGSRGHTPGLRRIPALRPLPALRDLPGLRDLPALRDLPSLRRFLLVGATLPRRGIPGRGLPAGRDLRGARLSTLRSRRRLPTLRALTVLTALRCLLAASRDHPRLSAVHGTGRPRNAGRRL